MDNQHNINQAYILKGDELNSLFQDITVSAFQANINSEAISIAMLSICSLAGAMITYQVIKNLKILFNQHQRALSSEFDLTNNRTISTEEIEESLQGQQSNSKKSFRKWITEPPSISEVVKIRHKRVYKAIFNAVFMFLGIYLVITPVTPFLSSAPYSIEFNKNDVNLKNIINPQVIQKQDIKSIEIKKSFTRKETDFFYPRCEITISTNNSKNTFIIKNYNMEKLRLKSCY